MRFVTCRLPDGMEDPAILSQDGTQVWPLSWLGLSYETLSDAIPFLTPQVRFGLQLAISGIPALPVEAVTLQSPIPCPAQDVVCLGINYMAHSDEAEKYSADAFSTQHQDAIYFSKRVSRAVPDGGFIEAHTDLVQKLDYECELAVVLGKDAKDVPAGQTKDYVFGYTILNDVSARDVQTAHKQWYFGKSLDGFTPTVSYTHLDVYKRQGQQSPGTVARQGKAGLFPHLPHKAVLRAFKPLKFAAHAHPFVVVVVVLLFDAVQHQVGVLPLQIAKGGAEDGKFRVHKCA